MTKCILVHANCVNPAAKGDFVFAGNIAKDIIQQLKKLEFGQNSSYLLSGFI